jgi:asparagine synthase (glutamine-hydrolysing)
VVLGGGNRVAQTLRQGNLLGALREANTQATHSAQKGSLKILLEAAWAELAPEPIRRLKRGVAYYSSDRRALSGKSHLASRFAREVHLLARRTTFRRLNPGSRPSRREYRLENIAHPHNAAARERYDRVAAAMGIEPRDPFMDQRVIEFCLSLPASQLHSAEWPKLILRRAMEGLVPDTVRWRLSKEHVGFEFTRSLLATSGHQMSLFAPMLPTLRRYTSHAEPWDVKPAEMDTDTYVELIGLSFWLERNVGPRVQLGVGEI